MIKDCHVLKVWCNDIGNGPGVRVTVWFAGCSHQCKECHNPETWKWNQGKELTEERIHKILDLCSSPYIEGLSLTGGDPMFVKNREGVLELCKKFKERFGNEKTIWMWTGFTHLEIKENPILDYVDVLIDGKFVEELKDPSLPYSGSTNQHIINFHR